jgi:hypothetical protein
MSARSAEVSRYSNVAHQGGTEYSMMETLMCSCCMCERRELNELLRYFCNIAATWRVKAALLPANESHRAKVTCAQRSMPESPINAFAFDG